MLKVGSVLPICALLVACQASERQAANQPIVEIKETPTARIVQPQPSAPIKSVEVDGIVGEWTELDRKCAVGPFGDGNGDGVGDDIANMEIRADGYGGYEWGCDLKPKVGAASTYNGKSICYSEGEASPPTRISFEIMADGKLKMTTPEGETVMKRCK